MTDLYYAPLDELTRLRTLNVAPKVRTALFATACRLNTLYMIKRAGSGHIGSSFSAMDIMAWLYLNEMEQSGDPSTQAAGDLYYSSKGHDAPGQYSLLLGLGLLDFELIHQLRRLGGLPGHPDVSTPFMRANTGSLGMGISKAKGMIQANRLQGKTGRMFVLTGDGELQEGQFWESLQSAANRKLGELTVIVDHNKLQSDTFVSRVSDLGDLEKKFAAFGWHVARCDGHDLDQLADRLEGFRAVKDLPKILIADTVKGKGVSFMESTSMAPDQKLYKFHSGAPDDTLYAKGAAELLESINRQLSTIGAAELKVQKVAYETLKPPEKAQKLVGAYSRAIVAAAERDSRIVAFDADLVLDTGLIPFSEKFPERFIECGIAEQDMCSQASGMALRGMKPFVHSFACFLSARPNEQIYNNATELRKIVYVGSLAGLVPAGPGHSHQCVRDLSSLRAMPNTSLLEPCNEAEVAMAVDYCASDSSDSVYLRLVSIPCAIPYELPVDYRLTEGRGVALTEGRDAIVIGYGPVMLTEAFKASRVLAKQGIGLKVVNLPWLNRVDPEWLRETIRGYRAVFTLDNHYLEGGQGQFLLSRMAELRLTQGRLLRSFGVQDIPACGRNDEALRAHGLDADSLADAFSSLLRTFEATGKVA